MNYQKAKAIHLSTIGILFIGFMISISMGIGTSPSSSFVYADSSSTDQVTLNVPSSCTLSSNVTTAHEFNTIGGTYKTNIGTTTLKVVCNDSNGFAIYTIGSGNNVDGNNKLVSSLGEDYDIASSTSTSGNLSAWSMKLTPVAGNYPLTMEPYFDDISGEGNNYVVVPSTWTKVGARTAGTDMPVGNTQAEGTSLTTTYAAYIATGQPAGTYTGKVKYAVMHPSSSTRPITLSQAYKLNGKSKVSATDPITGESGEYYKMQDMNTTICSSANITGEASQMEAVDIRDNKLYWITKMADGKCWMTENLDLDLISDPQAEGYVALTSENTNLTIYGSHGYDNIVVSGESNGYSCSNNSPTCENGIVTWLPERATIQPSDLSSTTWKNSNTNPYSYDRGNYEPDGYKNGHGKSGNYYNWTAAIASNNSSSYIGGVAANSICPKGWRLPNSKAYEFSKLFYAYGVTKDSTNGNGYATGGYNKLIGSPLYFVKSSFLNSGTITSRTNNGYYWYSSAHDSGYSFLLNFNNNVINTAIYSGHDGYGIYYNRYSGMSIRCLAE